MTNDIKKNPEKTAISQKGFKKMTQKKLEEILERHNKWLKGEHDGERADLRGVNLYGVNLCGANLRGANLHSANLAHANLRGTNLSSADLRCAYLYGAALSYANLSSANLRGANLYGAILSHGSLCGANLSSANLYGADLRYVDLTHAVYTDTILNFQCPEEGSFIAWKKLRHDVIAKLLIPEDAKRSSAITRKCRASKATVLAIYDRNGEPIDEGRSQHDCNFTYRVGETIYPDRWDEDRWDECSNGIHFFITRREAEEY